MSFFSTTFNSFGLDISDRSIKLAQIKKTSHGLELVSWNKINLLPGILTDGEIKNEQELINQIRKLINQSKPKITHNYVVACLPETKTFIKLISIRKPVGGDKEKEIIQDLVIKELPQHIPLPIDEIYFDWQVVNQYQDRFDILIGIAPRQNVERFSQLLKMCELIPVALEIEAQAITRAIFPFDHHVPKQPIWFKECVVYDWMKRITETLKHKSTESTKTQKAQKAQENVDVLKSITFADTSKNSTDTVYLIIDFGACRSGLIVWYNDTIKFAASLKTSGNYLTELISQKTKLDFDKAEKLKIIYGLDLKKGKIQIRKILEPVVKELGGEITKAQEFYQTHFLDHQNYEVILSGGSANLIGIDRALSKQLNTKVILANPLINICNKNLPVKKMQNYTTAIGLGLRSFSYL